MKKIMILMLTPLPFMFFTLRNDVEKDNTIQEQHSITETKEISALSSSVKEFNKESTVAPITKPFVTSHNTPITLTESDKETRLEMIAYALTLLGTPYVYAGSSTSGFDCSGFTTHVYSNFGVNVGRSSALQASDGIQIDRKDAREGDLLIFTGTNLAVREPGHAGIIISPPGDTISFVHSSSVGGVKVSKVEGTRYNDRLLQIRRVL